MTARALKSLILRDAKTNGPAGATVDSVAGWPLGEKAL